MKRLMIGAATAIALLAGPALASSSNSGADNPAATSAGVNDSMKNPPCVPGSNDLACGNATSGSSATNDWNNSRGTGSSGTATSGSGASSNPGLTDTPGSMNGSGSDSSRGTSK